MLPAFDFRRRSGLVVACGIKARRITVFRFQANQGETV
jgi:hypothetical protein